MIGERGRRGRIEPEIRERGMRENELAIEKREIREN